jgi:hypothetical protein
MRQGEASPGPNPDVNICRLSSARRSLPVERSPRNSELGGFGPISHRWGKFTRLTHTHSDYRRLCCDAGGEGVRLTAVLHGARLSS